MRVVVAWALGCVFWFGCAPSREPDVVSAQRQEQAFSEPCTLLDDVAPGQPRVFFSPFERPLDQVLCALDAAEREVLVAHYNIRSERVLEKLISLRKRGVNVRVAVDAKNAAQPWNTGDDQLEAAGIPITRFQPASERSIMHLKVVVIDEALAVTGSFNWNDTAAHANDENMIAFRDPAIVSRYHEQVRELLHERPRSVTDAQATPWAQVHFAPERQMDRVIVAALDGASSSIDVAMFTFTMRSIADALLRAHARGVRVRLIVEQKQDGLSDGEDRIAAAGALVIRAKNRIDVHSAMHQKYAVIDGQSVITGATNWTFSGSRTNEEDLLLLTHEAMARAYADNFADLLSIYAAIEDGEARAQAPVLFRGIHEATEWGDSLRVVGEHPALGAWNPQHGLVMGGELFPNWTTLAMLPPGAVIRWKLVLVHGDGRVRWEDGPDRVLQTPPLGRAAVFSASFGDTSLTWTPREEL